MRVYHAAERPIVNAGFIGRTIGIVPFLAALIIDAGHKVLIPLVAAISREMLDRCGKALALNGPHISASQLAHHLRIRTKRSRICNWISGVTVNINDRCKGPVCANTGSFLRPDLRQLNCSLLICCRFNFHRRGIKRSLPSGFRFRLSPDLSQ